MSEDESNLQSRAKTLSYTLEERKLLLKLVNKHHEVVNNRKVDSRSTNQKNQAWESIHQEFVSHSNIVRLSRTPQQLKRCWENIRSKAKRGDVVSIKLLKWGESLYESYMKNGGEYVETNGVEESISDPLLDEDSNSSTNINVKDEEQQDSMEISLNESLQQLTELTTAQSCQHCQCDKAERTARIELMQLKKLEHSLKVRNLRAQMKRDKELHRLAAHELSLKVENERRRAEILDKELNLHVQVP